LNETGAPVVVVSRRVSRSVAGGRRVVVPGPATALRILAARGKATVLYGNDDGRYGDDDGLFARTQH
jgi:hypothetical protein